MSAGLTLDDLFRRALVRNAHEPALHDPPHRAIAVFAETFRSLGLHTVTVVGMQLPNTVESVIAFLGIVRAGMVAAPLPVLWRRQEMVEALGRAGAKAIVTAAR